MKTASLGMPGGRHNLKNASRNRRNFETKISHSTIAFWAQDTFGLAGYRRATGVLLAGHCGALPAAACTGRIAVRKTWSDDVEAKPKAGVPWQQCMGFVTVRCATIQTSRCLLARVCGQPARPGVWYPPGIGMRRRRCLEPHHFEKVHALYCTRAQSVVAWREFCQESHFRQSGKLKRKALQRQGNTDLRAL